MKCGEKMKPEIKQRIEQIKVGQVPNGYKRTKAGIMPCEWCSEKEYKAKDVFKSVTNKKHNGEFEVLSATQDKGVIPRSQVDIDIKFNEDNIVGYKKVDKGDFVISLRSFQGGIEYSEYEGLVSPAYTVLKPKIPICDGYYKAYLKTVDYISRLNKGTYGIRDGKQIGFEDFGDMIIHYPSLVEQEKIAEILSAQDKVVALKEKLLEEKKKQKKYLMQQLLTGKKCLPGFSNKWIDVKLGDVFAERVETNRQELELLSVTGMNGVVPRSTVETKDNSSEDKSKYLRICKGDIGYNTMRMWQGVSALSEYEGIVSPAYTILIPNEKISAKYFSYLFKMHAVIFLFYRFSQGIVDDTRSLKYHEFAKLHLKVPSSKKEQSAIAEILAKADEEISMLQEEIEQEKQKKKALMQLLLTGIVRVNV